MTEKPKTQPTLTERFTYHSPSLEGVARHSGLSSAFIFLSELVEHQTLDCRERALALTKLEEAKMWASAAVARYEETR